MCRLERGKKRALNSFKYHFIFHYISGGFSLQVGTGKHWYRWIFHGKRKLKSAYKQPSAAKNEFPDDVIFYVICMSGHTHSKKGVKQTQIVWFVPPAAQVATHHLSWCKKQYGIIILKFFQEKNVFMSQLRRKSLDMMEFFWLTVALFSHSFLGHSFLPHKDKHSPLQL